MIEAMKGVNSQIHTNTASQTKWVRQHLIVVNYSHETYYTYVLDTYQRHREVVCMKVYLRPDLLGSVSVLECVVGVLITQARGTGVCVCVHVLRVCVQFFSLASHKPYSLFQCYSTRCEKS